MQKTSWQSVNEWYDHQVGDKGHYYHQQIVLPKLEALLPLNANDTLIDLACGQGVLARAIPTSVAYVGIDAAPSLIAAARKRDQAENHQFIVGDVTKKLPLADNTGDHATLILALQNLQAPANTIQEAARVLKPNGSFVIVINHPCFRIPRQSGWEVDEKNKLQYRRVNRYLSALKIPILANPSKGKQSAMTWSFHYPLQEISGWLHDAGFVIELIQEWSSNKRSEGKAAKMENRGRAEIPLFMAIRARISKTTL